MPNFTRRSIANNLDIYYFSGTGNSLVVARDVTQITGGRLIPVASMAHEERIKIDADAIGIVFPVYYETYGGIPLIIDRFIRKLVQIESKYIFAICTYGSGSIVTLQRLSKTIQSVGGKLAAGFTVNMPENVAGSRYNNPEMQQRMFDTWKESVGHICECINARKKIRYDTPNVMVGRLYALIKIVGIPLLRFYKPGTLRHLQKSSSSSLLSYNHLLPLMDKSFSTNGKCQGCGTCSRICPVANIQIVEDKPVWQHHCEFCLACFHWCPKQAIDCSAFPGVIRYHHPDVTLPDMMRNKVTG